MNKWLILSLAFGMMACGSEGVGDDDESEVQAQVSSLDGGVSVTPTADGGLGRAVSGAIGAACVADTDCTASGTTCVKEVSVFGSAITFPGGYCTKSCTADSECGTSGAGCPLAGAAAFLPEISQCLNPCKVASDCREGFRCGASSLPSFGGAAPASTGTFCLPPSPAGLPGGGGFPGGGFPGGGFPGGGFPGAAR